MVDVVIYLTYGGFALSEKEFDRYKELGGTHEYEMDIPRDCPILVQMVKELAPSYLRIVSVPDDTDWYIEDDDGREWVAEKHRTWY